MGLQCPSCFTNITGITVTTIDLIHNVGLIIIGDAILWMGKDLPECPEWLHVDLNIDV